MSESTLDNAQKTDLQTFLAAGPVARVDALEAWRLKRVIYGMAYGTPLAASTQATGAVKPVWRVGGHSEGSFIVGGTIKSYVSSTSDVTIPTGDVAVLAEGQSMVVAAVGTTGGRHYVPGTPATTGSELPPTAAQIVAWLVANSKPTTYVRLSKFTINRTGDTTVTQSQDNTARDV
jgi:hypothetical protein